MSDSPAPAPGAARVRPGVRALNRRADPGASRQVPIVRLVGRGHVPGLQIPDGEAR